jgi:UDP-glucose 4-epimerase
MLIIGGNGFIGRHLTSALLQRNRQVTIVGRAEHPGLPADWNVRYLTLDALEADFDAHLASTDTVVHLAARSVPGTLLERPWAELSENVEPSFQFAFRAARANPALRFIYLSSGGTVYGDGNGTPVDEEAPLRPMSSYGYGKLAAEEALRFLGRSIGLDFTILRVGNPVGRWQTRMDHGIVSVTLRAALAGRPITLYDGGRQVRDFFDADDLALAILAAADEAGAKGRTWNVGSGVGRSIIDIIGLVERVTGRTVEVHSKPRREVDMAYAVLDCSRIARELGWQATRPLEHTVAEMHRTLIQAGATT